MKDLFPEDHTAPHVPKANNKANPDTKRQCRAIWRRTLPSDHSEALPVRVYLKKRGLEEDDLPAAIHFHPKLRYYDENKIGEYPALVAKVCDVGGEGVALLRIYLTENGDKADVHAVKKALGPISGGAIRLDDPRETLHLAEGLETSLAVRQTVGEPTWATVSAWGLEKVELPHSVRTVHIWTDRDRSRAGEQSANARAARLHQDGKIVFVHLPDGPIPESQKSIDWLDVLNLNGPEYLQNALAQDQPWKPDKSSPLAEWQPPVPLTDFDLPEFPTATFPRWLRDYVETEAVATQTPRDLAGMLSLSTIGAAIAKKVVVEVKEGWLEPTNVFTVSAMAPGNRKSAVFADVLAPSEEFEKDENKRLAPEIREQEVAYKVLEEALKKAQRKAAHAKPEQRLELTERAIELSQELSELNISVRPRYIADDCSPERLASLLSEQAGRIALMSPEGDVFDLMAGRYSVNQAPNLGVYLKGHAGDTLRVDRVGRPPEYVQKPALTVGLTVQPEVVQRLAEKPGFRGRGLLARFLYSIPKSLLGLRRVDPPPVSAAIREQYHRNIRALLSLKYAIDGEGQPAPHVLRLHEAAHEKIQEFQAWLEPQLAELGELGTITDWAGKLVGQVCRIAGILHVAEFIELPAPWEIRVRRQTIERAIQIGKYLIPHAQAAFSLMGTDQTIANAEFILRWIKNKPARSFSRRELHQSTRRGRFSDIKDLEAALDLLVDHDFVREQIQEEAAGPGRKKSPEYEVNPQFVPNSEGIKDIEEMVKITKRDVIPQESKANEGEVKLSTRPQNPQKPQNSKNLTISTGQPALRETFRL